MKNKSRIRMNFDTLNSISQIRFGLKKIGQTCYTYDIPIDVLKKIGEKYKFILNKVLELIINLFDHQLRKVQLYGEESSSNEEIEF